MFRFSGSTGNRKHGRASRFHETVAECRTRDRGGAEHADAFATAGPSFGLIDAESTSLYSAAEYRLGEIVNPPPRRRPMRIQGVEAALLLDRRRRHFGARTRRTAALIDDDCRLATA